MLHPPTFSLSLSSSYLLENRRRRFRSLDERINVRPFVPTGDKFIGRSTPDIVTRWPEGNREIRYCTLSPGEDTWWQLVYTFDNKWLCWNRRGETSRSPWGRETFLLKGLMWTTLCVLSFHVTRAFNWFKDPTLGWDTFVHRCTCSEARFAIVVNKRNEIAQKSLKFVEDEAGAIVLHRSYNDFRSHLDIIRK